MIVVEVLIILLQAEVDCKYAVVLIIKPLFIVKMVSSYVYMG